MAGLRGQDRTPRAGVRERRNFDNLASVLEFVGAGEVIQVNPDGVFVVVLRDDGGLENDAGELAVLLDPTEPGLQLSNDGLKLLLASDPGLELSSGLRAKVAAPIIRDSSGIGLALATNPALELDSDALRVKVKSGGGITRDADGLSLGTLTTKGDLLTYSTALAALGVGSDGQILTADSGEATGLKWADPSGGAWEFLAEQAVSGSATTAVEFTGLDSDDYDSFMIAAHLVIASAGAFNVFVNGDTTEANYSRQQLSADMGTVQASRASHSRIMFGGTGEAVYYRIHITRTPGDRFVAHAHGDHAPSSGARINLLYSSKTGALGAAISVLRIEAVDANNIDDGSVFRLYGLKKA